MGIVKMMRWLPVAHAIAEGVEKANADGKVTYAEAIDVAADAAHACVDKLGIADKAIVEDAETTA